MEIMMYDLETIQVSDSDFGQKGVLRKGFAKKFVGFILFESEN
ncbi:MAG: hypothetical protein SOV71_05350 [Anaerovoracaceae bacterium]|nr:hypothetical protein [Bacillota bacterium]MDY2670963.1 hypothetical protein [Anaerovoracaceae bacterium]